MQKPTEVEPKIKTQPTNNRNKRINNEYKSDSDSIKHTSKIPRLSSVDRTKAPKPKKFHPSTKYKGDNEVKAEDAPQQLRRSQSYLESQKQHAAVENTGNINDLKLSSKNGPQHYSNKNLPNQNITSRRSVQYKPYTLREYKQKFNDPIPTEDEYKIKKRGGLGANIGNEHWCKENEKRERIKQFANNVKNKNMSMVSDSMRRTNQTSATENYEKSKRERALDYAKGIVKPNDRMDGQAIHLDNFEDEMIDDEDQSNYSYNYNKNQGYRHNNYSNYKDRIGYGDMEGDDNKFASEIDKIKALF
jgi:hypothetical protein